MCGLYETNPIEGEDDLVDMVLGIANNIPKMVLLNVGNKEKDDKCWQ